MALTVRPDLRDNTHMPARATFDRGVPREERYSHQIVSKIMLDRVKVDLEIHFNTYVFIM